MSKMNSTAVAKQENRCKEEEAMITDSTRVKVKKMDEKKGKKTQQRDQDELFSGIILHMNFNKAIYFTCG